MNDADRAQKRILKREENEKNKMAVKYTILIGIFFTGFLVMIIIWSSPRCFPCSKFELRKEELGIADFECEKRAEGDSGCLAPPIWLIGLDLFFLIFSSTRLLKLIM